MLVLGVVVHKLVVAVTMLVPAPFHHVPQCDPRVGLRPVASCLRALMELPAQIVCAGHAQGASHGGDGAGLLRG